MDDDEFNQYFVDKIKLLFKIKKKEDNDQNFDNHLISLIDEIITTHEKRGGGFFRLKS